MKFAITLLTLSSLLIWAGSPLGKPLTLKKQTAIAALAAKPADFVGKNVQVKGTVSEVCEKMGCWMRIVDSKSKSSVRIKVKDGEIVFPKTSVGKMAIAEGKLAKIEMTKEKAIEQAKHDHR